MKKLFLPLIATAAFIVIVGLLTQRLGSTPPSTPSLKQIKVKETTLKVELADTDPERRKGLSGRVTLPGDQGLLFVFNKENVVVPFWMKDMEIAIDIIWIDDNKIVQIDKNVQPEPGVPDSKLKIYKPDRPVDYVLEVNAGWSEKNNIGVGDSIVL